jgi:plasmid stabilization system protein ParE
MARVITSDFANADFKKIYSELATQAGAATVLKYRDSFRLLYRHLADFPESGAPRQKLGAHIRIGVVHPYVVIYRYIEASGTVAILRVIHGKRNITGKMLRA